MAPGQRNTSRWATRYLRGSQPRSHQRSRGSCDDLDIVSRAVRSRMMAAIKGSNTKPELAVRSALHRAGLRFRLHRRDLPGSPDLVFPRYRTVVFVHGCFWHRHPRCNNAHLPVTNGAWWREKLRRNQLRDRRQQRELSHDGWRVLVIWECEIASPRTMRDLEMRIRSARQG